MKNKDTNLEPLSAVKRAFLALEEMQAKLDAIERAKKEPIAIIGMACRFPGGAETPAAYWKLLQEGADVVSMIPPSRWDADAYYDPDPDAPDKMSTRWGGFVENVDLFDASFFHISPYEAKRMDPQQRFLLEVTHEALEDAGLAVDKLNNSQTGVFIGISTGDYSLLSTQQTEPINAYTGTGTALSVAAGRIAYSFGFQGPTLAVDTACSSSLVAVHLACQSLRTGESDMAVAGGVNLILLPDGHIYLSKLHALAADGHCKTFDASADGFTRGEGCGVVVLKRLSDALAAGDTIHALIRGSAVNQDGHSSGLTVPNGQAQQAVLRKALANAGVESNQISYVEAHGTGTSLGDPIEIRAIGSVYGAKRLKQNPLLVSSVKTNIGHLEAAGGIAGLIKTVLMLKNSSIPPHLHLKNRNPYITWDAWPIEIPLKTRSWQQEGQTRLAGVSAFGYSGTNAHIILGEATLSINHEPAQEKDNTAYLLPLSAHHPEALYKLVQKYRQVFQADLLESQVHDICYTASVRRSHHEYRLALTGQNVQEIGEQLATFRQREITAGSSITGQKPKVVFVFPGQGSQWVGMGQQLLQEEPIFRQALADCEEAMQPYVDWSLLQQVQADETTSRFTEIDVVQPVLFALQVALARLWSSWGILPQAVVGHSMGEVAAAHVAGMLSLPDAARIICRRSQLLRRIRGQGMMALVEADLQQAQELIADERALISIAASNGPRTTMLSGDTQAIEQLLVRVKKQGIFCRAIQVDVASHSSQVDPLRQEMQVALQGLKPQAGQVPLFSTVQGRWLTGEELDANYWMSNLREPVQFWQAMQQLREEGYTAFVEISAHPMLVTAMQKGIQLQEGTVSVISSLKRQQPERAALLQGLVNLYQQGADVSWEVIYQTGGRCVPLPSYPWQHEHFWIEIAGQRVVPTTSVQQQVREVNPKGGLSRDDFLALDPNDYQREIERYLTQLLARILDLNVTALSMQTPLSTTGIDSLMTIRLKNHIQLELEVELPVEEIIQSPNLTSLADILLERLVVTYLLPAGQVDKIDRRKNVEQQESFIL